MNPFTKICLPNEDNISDHRCERTDMAAKCKIFVTSNLTFHSHDHCVHICVQFQVTNMNDKIKKNN